MITIDPEAASLPPHNSVSANRQAPKRAGIGVRYAMACLIAATFLAAGCASSSRSVAGLENIHWSLAQLAGQPALTGANMREAYIMFVPDGARAQGSSGCNSFGGTYARDGERLSITRIISTKMACLDTGAMQQEAAFLSALGTTERWSTAGDKLTLYDHDGHALAEFAAVAQP